MNFNNFTDEYNLKWFIESVEYRNASVEKSDLFCTTTLIISTIVEHEDSFGFALSRTKHLKGFVGSHQKYSILSETLYTGKGEKEKKTSLLQVIMVGTMVFIAMVILITSARLSCRTPPKKVVKDDRSVVQSNGPSMANSVFSNISAVP
ncbi:hypothetical protein SNEBB_009616 [Seison nebaliae]|nr:hypothetical protein SNEBB_009616 [Seison nebaliae]